MSEYAGQQFVGIDLHRRRSVIHVMDGEGTKISSVRIVNEPAALLGTLPSASGLRNPRSPKRRDSVLAPKRKCRRFRGRLQPITAHESTNVP